MERYTTEIKGFTIQAMDKKPDGQGQQQAAPQQQAQQHQQPPQQAGAFPTSTEQMDDAPF